MVRGDKHDYVAVAGFRAALRTFERAAEEAARAAGLTPQRYLLLLMTKGAPEGGERATVNELAERLRLEPHTVTGAVIRAEAAGLVVRERDARDRRRTWIRLTPAGEQKLDEVVGALATQREHLVAKIGALADDLRAIGLAAGQRSGRSAG